MKPAHSTVSVKLAGHGTFETTVDSLATWQATVRPESLPFILAYVYEGHGPEGFDCPAYWAYYYPTVVLYVMVADCYQDGPTFGSEYPTGPLPTADNPEPYTCDYCEQEASANSHKTRVHRVTDTDSQERSWLHDGCISALQAMYTVNDYDAWSEGRTCSARTFPEGFEN